jgi:putative membrane protein
VIIDHPDFGPRIEALVGELEGHTEAEVVVVAARASGSYQDVRLVVAGVAAMATLLAVVYSPFDFHPLNLPLFMLALGALAWWLSGRSPALIRGLTRAGRRRAQVLEASKATFVEQAIHGTRGRTGVLVYVSELEGLAVLQQDLGVAGQVPGSAWSRLDSQARDLEELEALLRALGAILAEHLPASDDNPNEIPNAPVVRS